MIDCVELSKGKTGGRSEVLRKIRRERKNRKETKRNRQGCENDFHSSRVINCAYAYQRALLVRTHPASNAAITLRFPTPEMFSYLSD